MKNVSSLQMICDAMKKDNVTNCTSATSFYFMIPVTSATSERTIITYTNFRSSMTGSRLNNCLLLHNHRDLTDSLNLVSVAKNSSTIINNKNFMNVDFQLTRNVETAFIFFVKLQSNHL